MHSNTYVNNNTNTPYVSNTAGIAAAGVAGAILAGSITAAKEIRKVKDGCSEEKCAVATVAKEALGGGIAIASGVAVGKLLFRSGFLGAVTMVAVSVGVKYAYDGIVSKNTCSTVVEPAATDCKTKESKTSEKESKTVDKERK